MNSELLFTVVINKLRLNQTAHFLQAAVFLGGLVLSHVLPGDAWAADIEETLGAATGNALLKKYCSQCHGVPSPTDHKPGQWKNIVLRMQNHRLKRGYKRLSESEVIQVSQFLDRMSIAETTRSNRKMDNKNE